MEAKSSSAGGGSETTSDQELATMQEGFCSTSSLFRNSLCCYSCFGRRHSSAVDGSDFWERIRTTQNNKKERSFWGRGLIAFQKIREWSELVAGPRWKTFIRRFNRSRTGTCRQGKFQYDPLSYALNFDEGLGQNGVGLDAGDDYVGFQSFSVRFAAVPGTVNTAPGAGTEVRKDAAVLG